LTNFCKRGQDPNFMHSLGAHGNSQPGSTDFDILLSEQPVSDEMWIKTKQPKVTLCSITSTTL
jgi:hypothetical protein